MDIYCTRPTCTRPTNTFPDLDSRGTIKTIAQKFCTHCGMPLILGGRYIPQKPLARGGFGATYIGIDRYTPAMRTCAIKQLLPTGLTPQQMGMALQLFDREGAVLEDLGTHPQIPDLLAFFAVQAPGIQPGAPTEEFFYLVQEFIDGYTLEELLERQGAWSEGAVVALMKEILPVLQFVHEKGAIHRDIKPSNIMIRKQDKRVYLLDFGAVKQITAGSPAQRSTGIFTPGYAAPEQMRSDAVFPATDLYAFAVTCLHLLTGKPPEELFDPVTNRWNWRSHVQLSPKLAAVLDKMLEPAPSDRFDSAQAVLASLSQTATSSPVPAAPSPAPVPAPSYSAPPPVPLTPPRQASPPPTPSRPPAILSVPIAIQLFAAFALGIEITLLGLLASAVGFAKFGQVPSLMVVGAIALVLLLLRSTGTLDNKDLVLVVNIPTLLLVLGVQWWFKLALPSLPSLLLLLGVGGMAAVALATLFRLIYQVLYAIL